MKNQGTTPSLAIIEDDSRFAESVKDFLERRGFSVRIFCDGFTAKQGLSKDFYEVVIIDQNLPDTTGEELLRWASRNSPDSKIIIITAYPDIKRAVKAIKDGAFDYIVKPIDPEELLIVINRALDFQKLESYGEYNRKIRDTMALLKGNSKAITDMMNFIKLASAYPFTPVFISGETGTGKTLLAQIIHYHTFKNRPFVSINCAAIPEELIESELFGFEKGAFTGAARSKKGLFEIGREGTILLDEIGDMSLRMQAKLLQVFDTRTFRRIGGEKNIRLNARIITATNKNIEELMRKGEFRKDLYYRIAVLKFHIPPLRERKEDIVPIARFFIKEMGGDPEKLLDQKTRNLLMNYSYPGNVRELKNIIERAFVLGNGDALALDSLIETQNNRRLQNRKGEFPRLIEMERNYVLTVLNAYKGNKSRTAKALGISLSTLKRKLKKWGVQVEPPAKNE